MEWMAALMLGEYSQVIAQALNTWYTNHLEQKRLKSIFSNFARHWKNRVSTIFLFMQFYVIE
jgi:hypothetical protein